MKILNKAKQEVELKHYLKDTIVDIVEFIIMIPSLIYHNLGYAIVLISTFICLYLWINTNELVSFEFLWFEYIRNPTFLIVGLVILLVFGLGHRRGYMYGAC